MATLDVLPRPRQATLVKSSLGKEVWVQNPALVPFVEGTWLKNSASELLSLLKDTLRIDLTEQDFVKASNRSKSVDPTNYDAVWVRDSVWVYHAFKQQGEKSQAVKVLNALLDYFTSPAQMQRMDRVIAKPSLIEGSSGPMEVLHIRFDGNSPQMADVQVNGEPQFWNHKQNDALGIFYSAVAESLDSKWVTASEISAEGWKFLVRLPTYLEKIRFYEMPDAGAWEEIERINTSSIALVTDSLERWSALVERPDVLASVQMAAKELSFDYSSEALFDSSRLNVLIRHGYDRIQMQLPYESPTHEGNPLLYRQADAALLNLLYPCQLKSINVEQLLHVLKVVESLSGERGIRRYFHDAYQSGNYWLKNVVEAGLKQEDLTDDCSAPSDFEKRTSRMLTGTEAQWFFDSWLSFGVGEILKRTDLSGPARIALEEKQIHYLHRALGQITGGTESQPEIGADGKSVLSWSCPESYNTLIYREGPPTFAPSPITPLNWAKAGLSMALHSLK